MDQSLRYRNTWMYVPESDHSSVKNWIQVESKVSSFGERRQEPVANRDDAIHSNRMTDKEMVDMYTAQPIHCSTNNATPGTWSESYNKSWGVGDSVVFFNQQNHGCV